MMYGGFLLLPRNCVPSSSVDKNFAWLREKRNVEHFHARRRTVCRDFSGFIQSGKSGRKGFKCEKVLQS